MNPTAFVFLVFSTVLGMTGTRAEELIDPCDMRNDDGTMIMYCSCSSNDAPETTEVQCYVNNEISVNSDDRPEWTALSTLSETRFLEFIMRSRFMKDFPPPIIFQKMSKLEVFYVKMGAIDLIPAFAFQNSSSIAEVTLKDNKIRELGVQAFSNMRQLKEINLDTNEIKIIERNTFVNLPSLRHLILGANAIEVIHDQAFKSLESLEELELHKNNLTYLTPEVFMGLQNLKRLDLMKNTIQFLGNNVFTQMPNLEDLDLTENNIISVSATAFHGLTKLGRLNLRGNKIVDFLPGTFAHLEMIYFLDVRENQLETFSQDLISNIYTNLLNESMQLIMKDNRFKCDCRILWMNKLWNETNSQMVQYYLNQTMCDVPHKFALALDETDLDFSPTGDKILENVTLVLAPVEETTISTTGSSSIHVTAFRGEKCMSDGRKPQRHRSGQRRVKSRPDVKALPEVQALDDSESNVQVISTASARRPDSATPATEPVNDVPMSVGTTSSQNSASNKRFCLSTHVKLVSCVASMSVLKLIVHF